jgi:hypothetical protein
MRDSWGWVGGGAGKAGQNFAPPDWRYFGVVQKRRHACPHFERRESRIANRVSSQQQRVSSKQHPLLHSSIRITPHHTMTCILHVKCVSFTPPPQTRYLSTPHSHNSSSPDLLFSIPIGPDNALAILHASRALAVQGVSRLSGANIARLGRRHSNYGGEGVQYPNIPGQKGRASPIHERAREEDTHVIAAVTMYLETAASPTSLLKMESTAV